MCLVNTPSPASPNPNAMKPDYLHNQALDNLRNSLSYVRAARNGVNSLTIPLTSAATQGPSIGSLGVGPVNRAAPLSNAASMNIRTPARIPAGGTRP